MLFVTVLDAIKATAFIKMLVCWALGCHKGRGKYLEATIEQDANFTLILLSDLPPPRSKKIWAMCENISGEFLLLYRCYIFWWVEVHKDLFTCDKKQFSSYPFLKTETSFQLIWTMQHTFSIRQSVYFMTASGRWRITNDYCICFCCKPRVCCEPNCFVSLLHTQGDFLIMLLLGHHFCREIMF